MTNGTVTMSLKDYLKLKADSEKAEQAIEEFRSRTKKVIDELEVFVTYIAQRENIKPLVEEFNRQSTKTEITFSNNRIQIKPKR